MRISNNKFIYSIQASSICYINIDGALNSTYLNDYEKEIIKKFEISFEKQQKLLIDFFTLGHIAFQIVFEKTRAEGRILTTHFYDYIDEELNFRYSFSDLLNNVNKYFAKHDFGYLYELLMCMNIEIEKQHVINCNKGTSEKEEILGRNVIPNDIDKTLLTYHLQHHKNYLKHRRRVQHFHNNIKTAEIVFEKPISKLFDDFFRSCPLKYDEYRKILNERDAQERLARLNIKKSGNRSKYKKWETEWRRKGKLKLSQVKEEIYSSASNECAFKLLHIKLWAMPNNDFSDSEIKTILSRFKQKIKAYKEPIKLVQKIFYDSLVGLQVDLLILAEEFNIYSYIQKSWGLSINSLFPNVGCFSYVKNLDRIMDLENTKSFIRNALIIPCLIDTEFKPQITAVRSFTTSRKNHGI